MTVVLPVRPPPIAAHRHARHHDRVRDLRDDGGDEDHHRNPADRPIAVGLPILADHSHLGPAVDFRRLMTLHSSWDSPLERAAERDTSAVNHTKQKMLESQRGRHISFERFQRFTSCIDHPQNSC